MRIKQMEQHRKELEEQGLWQNTFAYSSLYAWYLLVPFHSHSLHIDYSILLLQFLLDTYPWFNIYRCFPFWYIRIRYNLCLSQFSNFIHLNNASSSYVLLSFAYLPLLHSLWHVRTNLSTVRKFPKLGWNKNGSLSICVIFRFNSTRKIVRKQ